MLFLPLTALILILFLLLPVLILELAGSALVKLGITPHKAALIIYLSLLGSLVNIPLVVRYVDPLDTLKCPISFIGMPVLGQAGKQIIAINVGGAIIPLLICLYLLPKAPLLKTIAAVAVSSVLAYKLARPVAMIGIGLPVLIPPLVSALLAVILSPKNPVPIAYISGVLGVLIGADLMNLRCLNSPGIMSIGGAGVFDGIFLVGVISALLG
ncbi:MAG: DUF1614 domain-containing protein [Candidatus Omnitrophica bacterium]|nr:DUF1614 domain-containing protein [Candidatus Omnitrophota bacterium]